MADIFDTLKKHSDRITDSKSKKVKREKTRPWHDYTITTKEVDLKAQNEPSEGSFSNPSEHIPSTQKIAQEPSNKSVDLRKQSVNNTETNVYVNDSDYVNNTETESENKPVITNEIEENVNNTDTNVYVNDSDYANNTETKTRPGFLGKDVDRSKDLFIKEGAETNVYVNDSDYVNNTETNSVGFEKNKETFVYVNKAETERKQSANNTQTAEKQYDINEKTERKQKVNNTTLNTETSTETERKQLSPELLVYSLSRSEEKILKFLVELCLNSASLTTPKLTYRLISNATQITEKSCKTLIGRLKNKSIVKLDSYTKGPGSYTIFSIPQQVYNSVLYISGKSVLFDMRKQYGNNAETQSPQSTETIPSSKLVSNLISTNNTIKNKIFDFNVEDLQIDELRLIGINGKAVGDAIRNLTKFLENNPEIQPLARDDFQDFINKFVLYANSSNGKTMKSKQAVFIHEIQKFQKEGTCSTIDWSNDYDLEVYKQFVNEQEEKMKRENELVEKAIEYAFLIWRNNLNKEETIDLVPENQFSKYGSPGYELVLKKYYRDNIWKGQKTIKSD